MPVDPTYPVGYQTVSNGTLVTSDALLANNGRIVGRKIRDLALQKFYLAEIFAPAGPIVGGGQLYEQATQNELYAARDVERIEPGDEYPRITFDRQGMLTAQVEKFGGEFEVPEESAIRHRVGYITRRAVMLANTIRRKTEYRGMAELDAAIATFSRTAVGTSWADATGLTFSTTSPSALPIADIANVVQANQERELGYDYDFMIVSPSDWANLYTVHGSTAKVKEMLTDQGIMGYWVTNRQAAGTAKFLARQMVGEMGFEESGDATWATTSSASGAGDAALQISTKVYKDEGRDTDIVKARVKPIFYVTDPYAIIELSGLAA
jgi:hypothetical protein